MKTTPRKSKTKICKVCGKTKNKDLFRKWNLTCIVCQNASKRKANMTDAEWAKVRTRRNAYQYGVNGSKYRSMLKEQYNRCLICKRMFTEEMVPSIDHCHETGKVRGLLCRRCNTGIGMLGDDTSRLQTAIHYLNKCH